MFQARAAIHEPLPYGRIPLVGKRVELGVNTRLGDDPLAARMAVAHQGKAPAPITGIGRDVEASAVEAGGPLLIVVAGLVPTRNSERGLPVAFMLRAYACPTRDGEANGRRGPRAAVKSQNRQGSHE